MSDEPLDSLESALGEPVTVRLKAGDTYHGTLTSYDQHMNLVLEAVEAAPGDGDGQPLEQGRSRETVDNTTVIRGDNVVSIET